VLTLFAGGAGDGAAGDNAAVDRDGSAGDRVAGDGVAGVAGDGATGDGATRDGAAEDGAARDGAAVEGTTGDSGWSCRKASYSTDFVGYSFVQIKTFKKPKSSISEKYYEFSMFRSFCFYHNANKKEEGTFNTKSIVKWHKTNVNGKCHPIFTAKKNDLAIKILMFDISKENIFNFIQSTFCLLACLPLSLVLLSSTSVSLPFLFPAARLDYTLYMSRK
jgi:hypothetical protein